MTITTSSSYKQKAFISTKNLREKQLKVIRYLKKVKIEEKNQKIIM